MIKRVMTQYEIGEMKYLAGVDRKYCLSEEQEKGWDAAQAAYDKATAPLHRPAPQIEDDGDILWA